MLSSLIVKLINKNKGDIIIQDFLYRPGGVYYVYFSGYRSYFSSFIKYSNAFKLTIGRKKADSILQLKRAKEAVKLAGKTSLASGAMATCCGFIINAHNCITSTGTDINSLVAGSAASLITMFYGLILYLFLLPVKSKLEVRISDFMQD